MLLVAEVLERGIHAQDFHIPFDVMHTLWHTPENISFVLTDQEGGADQPMDLFQFPDTWCVPKKCFAQLRTFLRFNGLSR